MKDGRSRRQLGEALIGIVGGVLAGILIWQATRYAGPVAHAAEWQFGVADRYWPTLTVLLPVLLVVLIGGAILFFHRRRRARREQPVPVLTPLEQCRKVLAGEVRLLRVASILAALALVAALFCLIVASRFDESGTPAVVDARAAAEPAQGPARLVGRADLSRIAVLKRNIFFMQHTLFLAPIVDGTGPVRYLVEIERVEGPRETWRAPEQGFLRRYDAARELAPVYRDAEILLAAHPFILFRSADALRWEWSAAAIQFGLFALLAGAFALLFRRRSRRLATFVAEQSPTPFS